MSQPKAQQTTRSVANPTPIKYLGLSFGRRSVDKWTILQNWSFPSPPLENNLRYYWFSIKKLTWYLSPPTAKPATSRSISCLALSVRNLGSNPPWTIGKRFWVSGRLCAFIQRSNHRVVLLIKIIWLKKEHKFKNWGKKSNTCASLPLLLVLRQWN